MNEEKPNDGLPELKGGELLIDKKERTWRVHRVRHGRRDTGFDEPLYRLERIVLGNREWTLDELEREGLRVFCPAKNS